MKYLGQCLALSDSFTQLGKDRHEMHVLSAKSTVLNVMILGAL